MAKIIRQAVRKALSVTALEEVIEMLKREWFPLLSELREAFNTWGHPEYRIKLGGHYVETRRGNEFGTEPSPLGAEDSVTIDGLPYDADVFTLDAWFDPNWYPEERHGYVDRKIYLEVDAYWVRDQANSVGYVLWDTEADEEITSSRVEMDDGNTRAYLLSDALDVYDPDDPDDTEDNKIRPGVRLYRLYVYIASGSEVGFEDIGALNAHLVIRYERPA